MSGHILYITELRSYLKYEFDYCQHYFSDY